MKPALVYLLTFLCAQSLLAAGTAAPYPGYVSDVKTEKSERYQEVYLFIPRSSEKSLQDKIFSPLTHEFKEKYREKFGQLDTESIVYQHTEFSAFDEKGQAVQSVELENDQRKSFAEYMTKRLIEYHVDNYMKTEPQMRPILEAKEKIQNVKVEVTKQVRLNMQYNLAGNTVDFIVDNPYCESKVSLEMDSHSFGPSNVEETRLWLTKSVSKTVALHSNTSFTDGIVYADVSKSFPRTQLASFVGASTYINNGGTSIRESKYLVGASYTF